MRVLHFFKTYWPDTFGGVERTIHALASNSARFGIEATVLTVSGEPKDAPFAFDNHLVVQAKRNFHVASTDFSIEAIAKFRSLVQHTDVIHFHFPWPFMDMVNLMVGHDKPYVVTYHSDIVKQKLLLQLYTPLMYRFLRKARYVIATSDNYIGSSRVLQKLKNVRTIPLGLDDQTEPFVDPDRLAYWKTQFPGGLFLFVGVLRYYKGVRTLYEAAKATGLPVVLIGGGGQEDEFRQLVKADGLSNFHMVGMLSDVDKAALLSLSRCVVLPSPLRSEAFGLALVEAARAGKPMISCEIGTGTSFVNKHGETGYTIPPNDVASLSDAMRALWDNDAIAQQFGAAARMRYEQLFTAEKMLASYVEVYRDAVSNSSKTITT